MAEDSGTAAPMTAERLAELRGFRTAWRAAARRSRAFDVEFELLAEVDRLRAIPLSDDPTASEHTP